jgi:transcriptional regulator with GAF, ATPase, and Fis domain
MNPVTHAGCDERRVAVSDDPPGIAGVYGIVGRSPALQHVLSVVERVASTDAAILIRGETGAASRPVM